MASKNTIKINAPKRVVEILRVNYPNLKTDSARIAMLYDRSLLLEPLFRERKKKL